MKRSLTLLLFVALMMTAFAQNKQQLRAIYSYTTFNIPGEKPYVEVYLQFDGSSLEYKYLGNNQNQATVEVVLSVKKADSLVHIKKYDLNGPLVQTGHDAADFIDLQRFAIENGTYDLSVSIKDKNAVGSPVVVMDKLVVAYDETPSLSSVQPMASAVPTQKQNILSRGGYDMTPYINDFYPEEINTLNFYYEIYNIDKEVKKDDFLTTYYIEKRENGQRWEKSFRIKKQHPRDLVPVFGSIDIRELPSGNYNLVVEARNRENQLMLYHRVPFMRKNTAVAADAISEYSATFAGQINEESQLNYYLLALYPISTPTEAAVAEQLATKPGQMDEKQAFFYTFWQQRNSIDPESAWREYKKRLDFVSARFTFSNIPGFRTDRGRVYLKYGAPDFERDEKNFVSTRGLGHGDLSQAFLTGNTSGSKGHVHYLPYILWRYNELPGDGNNRCFIFWDEQRSGYYKLLHSNAKGEVQEYGWERRLSQQQLNEDVEGEVTEQFNRGH